MKKFARFLCLALVAVMLCATLASCGGPATEPADAKAALTDNGYTVTLADNDILLAGYALLGIEKLDAVVTGAKVDGEAKEAITIFYFEDADAAEAAFEKIETNIYDKASDAEKEDVVFKKSGAMVYMGTKQAVKDAK